MHVELTSFTGKFDSLLIVFNIIKAQIQEILGLNLRNKLRLILSQVRKVQLARGIMMDSATSQESGYIGSS